MLGQSPIIKFVLFGIFAFGVGVVVLNSISYGRRQKDFDLTEKNHPVITSFHNPAESIASKTDLKSKNNKPTNSTIKQTDISKISIRTYKISMNNEMHENILVRESGEGNYHILLLHGGKYSSTIWKKIHTLQYLSNWGYHAFAIDIPRNKNKTFSVIEDKTIAIQWLTKLIKTLHLSNLVIISPSISGRLTLPYMFQLNKQQDLIRGFVYIAPMGTKQYHASDYKKIQIPTLIVHGEKDIKFTSAFESLKQIPTSEVLLIKNTSHDSYYENPIEFHKGLQQFLDKIYRLNNNTIRQVLKKKDLLTNLKKSQDKHNH
ncbi:unnamed protein product [Rotaria sordida]|uniref:Alpha/beta hydrolase n=1 Tax=Rotaria sordida TaxID=392033 RepID=A0A814UZ10_9BILA|nr:unnamed protein product [Rotaria sordida]